MRTILFLFSIMYLFGLVSCEKETINTTEIIPEIVVPEEVFINGLLHRSIANTDDFQIGCLHLSYPFRISRLDETSIVIDSKQKFTSEKAIENADNPWIDIVYPIEVIDENNNIYSVKNTIELGKLFIGCIPNIGWDNTASSGLMPAWNISNTNSCYEFDYPLELFDNDFISNEVSGEEELLNILSNGNLYHFGFPLSLIDQQNQILSAADADQLLDHLVSCSSSTNSKIFGVGTYGCFGIKYPVSFFLADGSKVILTDDNEFARVYLQEQLSGFDYPITLIDEEGIDLEVKNKDELVVSLFLCQDFITPTLADFVCYDFIYPFSVIDLDGATIVILDNEDWQVVKEDYDSFVFPIKLVHYDSNAQRTILSKEDLQNAIEDCY